MKWPCAIHLFTFTFYFALELALTAGRSMEPVAAGDNAVAECRAPTQDAGSKGTVMIQTKQAATREPPELVFMTRDMLIRKGELKNGTLYRLLEGDNASANGVEGIENRSTQSSYSTKDDIAQKYSVKHSAESEIACDSLHDAKAEGSFCKHGSTKRFHTNLSLAAAARLTCEKEVRDNSNATWPMFDDGSRILQQMGARIAQIEGSGYWVDHRELGLEAKEAFERIRAVDIWDVFALRETWTDEDTEYIQRLDSRPGAFIEGALSTERFATMALPRAKDLCALLRRGSIAVVGSGPSLRGHGQEIDAHAVVSRFNDLVSTSLDSNDTGIKTDIHVMNMHIKPPHEPDVLQFDLDGTRPFGSLCNRLRQLGGINYDEQHRKRLFFLRPTALCALAPISGFTRGFLFYWFVARFFQRADLYGMGSKDGHDHYAFGAKVAEPFIDFEHLLYTAVNELQSEAEQRSMSLVQQVIGGDARQSVTDMSEAGCSHNRLNMFPWP